MWQWAPLPRSRPETHPHLQGRRTGSSFLPLLPAAQLGQGFGGGGGASLGSFSLGKWVPNFWGTPRKHGGARCLCSGSYVFPDSRSGRPSLGSGWHHTCPEGPHWASQGHCPWRGGGQGLQTYTGPRTLARHRLRSQGGCRGGHHRGQQDWPCALPASQRGLSSLQESPKTPGEGRAPSGRTACSGDGGGWPRAQHWPGRVQGHAHLRGTSSYPEGRASPHSRAGSPQPRPDGRGQGPGWPSSPRPQRRPHRLRPHGAAGGPGSQGVKGH